MPGHPGMEGPVAQRIAKEFKRFTPDVQVDKLGNVVAAMGPKDAPAVLVCAHMDEVGLIVTGFDERGGLYIQQMGGVDPRILPGAEVTVHGKEPVYGLIGVKPPHLTQGNQKAPTYKTLVIDTGYSKEAIEKLVRVGDPVSFIAPVMELANGRIASRTLDDRACVAQLLVAMELLQNVNLTCRVYFAATAQEEVGSRGAMTAAYDADPVVGIALDVTHGPMPGVESSQVVPLDSVAITKGPVIHPAVFERLTETAKKLNVKYEVEIASRMTYTDGDSLQVARQGIPTGLFSIPLSYMHTTVETISLHTLEEGGRLLAGFVQGIGADWEEWLCYKD